MFETSAELASLQALLDASYAGASTHLRGIINDERTLRASEIVGVLSGMRTLCIATVTATGEPRISAVDGHFLHAGWVFSTSVSSPKAHQLAARPAVSAAYLEGEEVAVFTHGDAHKISVDDPAYGATLAYLTDHYDSSPLTWGDTALYRVAPGWMVGYAAQRDTLLAARGVRRESRDEDVT